MTDPKPNLIIEAKRFARGIHAHIGLDTVSGDRKPQMEHLQEVVDLVWASGGTDTEIAAAWLHDSVEDTSTTLEDIEKQFGQAVAKIVESLTDLEEIKDLPTKERKAKQTERVKTESDSTKRIKMADQISNMRLVTVDPSVNWPLDDNKDYVMGAKAIADECRGVSTVLDELFDREYAKSKSFFKIS